MLRLNRGTKITLGVITAVGGGAIRDIAVGKIPSVLGGNTLYATSALAASATAVLFYEAGHPGWGMASATAIGAALCLLARWRGPLNAPDLGWSFPTGQDACGWEAGVHYPAQGRSGPLWRPRPPAAQ